MQLQALINCDLRHLSFPAITVSSKGYSWTPYTSCKQQCYCKYVQQGYYPTVPYNVMEYVPYPACQKDNERQCKDQ